MTTQTKNTKGLWVDAIPLPYYLRFGRVKCECGKKFRSEEAYQGHYALKHILFL